MQDNFQHHPCLRRIAISCSAAAALDSIRFTASAEAILANWNHKRKRRYCVYCTLLFETPLSFK